MILNSLQLVLIYLIPASMAVSDTPLPNENTSGVGLDLFLINTSTKSYKINISIVFLMPFQFIKLN